MTDQEIAISLSEDCERSGHGGIQTPHFKIRATVHEWDEIIHTGETIIRRATVSAEGGTYRFVAELRGWTKAKDFTDTVLAVLAEAAGAEGLVALQGIEWDA